MYYLTLFSFVRNAEKWLNFVNWNDCTNLQSTGTTQKPLREERWASSHLCSRAGDGLEKLSWASLTRWFRKLHYHQMFSKAIESVACINMFLFILCHESKLAKCSGMCPSVCLFSNEVQVIYTTNASLGYQPWKNWSTCLPIKHIHYFKDKIKDGEKRVSVCFSGSHIPAADISQNKQERNVYMNTFLKE